jgi:16S rRNA (uracil1498-N3)-methyltransferase
MRRLLVESIEGEALVLHGEQHHRAVRVLRMARGDRLRVFDGRGHEYEAVVEAAGRDQVTLRVERELRPAPEPGVRIVLFQSIPRGDAMERVVQKGVEIGVAEVVPLITRRTVARPARGEGMKLARWRKIALHAVEQSGRAWLVPVGEPMPTERMVERLSSFDLALMPHHGAVAPLRAALEALRKPRSAAVIIGPEGGFAPEEVEHLAAAGARPVSLGQRVLRSETAGLVAAALVLYHFGDMG